MYTVLADTVLVLHFVIVLFVVGGLILVLAGNGLGWSWVNRKCFRFAHLAAIASVVAVAWLGITCPLTTLEAWLRVQAGGTASADDFIAYWVRRWLFFTAPDWVFTLAYTTFGALVAWAWRRFPPKPFRPGAESDAPQQTSANIRSGRMK